MKISVISHDRKAAENIYKKLVFLRSDDNIILADTIDLDKNTDICDANVILVYENTSINSTVKIIKQVRINKNAIVILIANSSNAELILDCKDNGADDFILSDADDYEFVLRIVKNIEFNSNKLKLLRVSQLLSELQVVDKEEFVYNKEYSKIIINTAIESENIQTGSFMLISPTIDDKYTFSQSDLTQKIKSCIRAKDIYTYSKGLQHLLFLPETNMNGALKLFNRIKENLKFDICCGISDIFGKSYKEFEKEALSALTEALANKAEFVFAQNNYDDTLNKWLDDTQEKNYKIFRKIFNKKLEKVIEPVFYRLQQTYDGKIDNTKIEQTVNGDICFFKLSNDKHESILKIVYPGFSKILIYIEHSGLDTGDNKEFDLQLSEVTEKQLITIIEDFVSSFTKF